MGETRLITQFWLNAGLARGGPLLELFPGTKRKHCHPWGNQPRFYKALLLLQGAARLFSGIRLSSEALFVWIAR